MLQKTRIILVLFGFFFVCFSFLCVCGFFCLFVWGFFFYYFGLGFSWLFFFPYLRVRSVYKSWLPEISCELQVLLVTSLYRWISWNLQWWALGQMLPLTKLMWMRTWWVLHFFFLEVWKCHSESVKWSFTAGWGGCREGCITFSHLREPGQSLGVPCQVGTAVARGLFPKGGGWVGLKYMFQFPEWDGSIFPCPLWIFLWVRTGKLNMNSCCVFGGIESSHSDLLFIFIWEGGEGVCSKDLKMLQTLFFTNDW